MSGNDPQNLRWHDRFQNSIKHVSKWKQSVVHLCRRSPHSRKRGVRRLSFRPTPMRGHLFLRMREKCFKPLFLSLWPKMLQMFGTSWECIYLWFNAMPAAMAIFMAKTMQLHHSNNSINNSYIIQIILPQNSTYKKNRSKYKLK